MRTETRAILVIASFLGVVCPACESGRDRGDPLTPAQAARSVDVDAPNGVCREGAIMIPNIGCVDDAFAYSPDGIESCREMGMPQCEEACQKGDPSACTSAAILHQFAIETTPNTTYAAALFEKACATGDGGGCNNLGVLHGKGIGFPVDVERAETLYEVSCDHGSVVGCANLAMGRTWSADPPQNVANAASVAQRACEASADARACSAVGWMRERGSVLARDEKLAAELYQKACDGGQSSACERLGKLYLAGTGVGADDVTALNLFRKACNDARSDACTDLATMYCMGRGVPRDPPRSTALIQQACHAGDRAACRSKECSGVLGL
jgi:TPR repeat protein